ncbi:unnamed protein product [Absidia cylindrospora]
MDGYLQTALVANGPPQPPRVSPSAKLLKPCPPSNKDFHCDNVHAVEGTYQLVNEIHFDTIAPQFSSGTRTCIEMYDLSTSPNPPLLPRPPPPLTQQMHRHLLLSLLRLIAYTTMKVTNAHPQQHCHHHHPHYQQQEQILLPTFFNSQHHSSHLLYFQQQTPA